MPPPNLEIFRGSQSADLDWLIPAIRSSYWGSHLTDGQIMSAIECGPCFSACVKDKQLGFARLITDYCQVSLLTDVIVDEQWRRQGVGSAIMNSIVNDRLIKKTLIMLECRPENVNFYARFGFQLSVHGGRFMKRNPT